MTLRLPSGWTPQALRWRAPKPTLWFVFFVLVSVLAVVPLFVVKRPPSHDFPQHLAAVHMLRVYPEQGLGAELDLQLGRSQYIGFYALAVLLTFPFGVLLGTKLSIAAIALAIAMGVWALLQALDRDPRHAFFALPLTLSTPLLFGLYGYMAGIALLLFSFAAAVRLAESYCHRRFLTLSFLLTLMSFTHFVPVMFALVGCALVLAESNDGKASQNLWSLAPCLLLTLIWMLTAPAAGPTAELPKLAARSLQSVLSDLPGWLNCVLTSGVDEWLFLAWLMLAVTHGVLAIVGSPLPLLDRRDVMTRRLAWLVPIAWLCYLLLPEKHQWVYPVGPRFAVLAALLSVMLLGRISELRTALSCIALACIVMLQTVSLSSAFRQVQKEEGDIDSAIRAIPAGRRVAAIIFDQRPKAVTLPAFRHYSSLYQAKKGGIVSRSFVGQPTSPFAYKHGLPPEPTWPVKAKDIDPVKDFAWFEYLLVRGGPAHGSGVGPYTLIHAGKRWRVYRRADNTFL